MVDTEDGGYLVMVDSDCFGDEVVVGRNCAVVVAVLLLQLVALLAGMCLLCCWLVCSVVGNCS